MASENGDIERRLWSVADQLRANSGLKPSEYSRPVLGLLFLRYADGRFAEAEKHLQPRAGSRLGAPTPDAFKARGIVYLTPEARFSHLLALPEGSNLGRALNSAMDDIERHNPDLLDALPKNYGAVGDDILRELIKTLAPLDIDGDAFGRVYEEFMGNFAKQEMQKGGEYYTPSSIVRLIVEIIEPYHGRILDPACGSGGMFVHSADFVRAHEKAPEKELSIFGIEKVSETQRLARMNLAVHGLGGTIREANSYYEEPFPIVGQFDFVMANPPFNVDGVDKEKDAIKKRADRFPFGLPKPDNGNYLWIEMFWSALNDKGRAGFVMANSAADARGTELDIRKGLIETGHGRLHRLGRAEFLHHRHSALRAVVPRQGQGEDEAKGRSAVHRRAAHFPPDRPCPSRLHAGAGRVFGQHRAAVARRADGAFPQFLSAARRARPWEGLCRRSRPLQGGDPRRDRGAGVEPQSGALCRPNGAGGGGRGFSRKA